MTPRNDGRFVRLLKRCVVAVELVAGAFLLATFAGLLASQYAGPLAENVDVLTRFAVSLLLIGGVLFYDGVRRGREWW